MERLDSFERGSELEKRLMKWEKTREMGKKNFMIYRGVLGWGIITGILFFIFQRFFVSGHTANFVLELIITLCIFMIAGILFGFLVWRINESQYQEYMSN